MTLYNAAPSTQECVVTDLPLFIYKRADSSEMTEAEMEALSDRQIAELETGRIDTDYIISGGESFYPTPIIISDANHLELNRAEHALSVGRPKQIMDAPIDQLNKRVNGALFKSFVTLVPGALMMGYGGIKASAPLIQYGVNLLEKEPSPNENVLDGVGMGLHLALALGGAYVFHKSKQFCEDYLSSLKMLYEFKDRKKMVDAKYSVAIAARREKLDMSDAQMMAKLDDFLAVTDMEACARKAKVEEMKNAIADDLGDEFAQDEDMTQAFESINPEGVRQAYFTQKSTALIENKDGVTRRYLEQAVAKDNLLKLMEATHADLRLMASPRADAEKFKLTI